MELEVRVQTVFTAPKADGSRTVHARIHGSGVGQPSGLKYTLNANDHVFFDGTDVEERFYARPISKGPGDNEATVIVRRDGQVSLEVECRG